MKDKNTNQKLLTALFSLSLTFVLSCQNNMNTVPNGTDSVEVPEESVNTPSLFFSTTEETEAGFNCLDDESNITPDDPWGQDDYYDNNFLACGKIGSTTGLILKGEMQDDEVLCVIPADYRAASSSNPQGNIGNGHDIFTQLDESTNASVKSCFRAIEGRAYLNFDNYEFHPNFNFNSLFVVSASNLGQMLTCLGTVTSPRNYNVCPLFSFGVFK